MIRFPAKSTPVRRRGAILIVSLLLIVLMLGMMAFSIDIGYIVLARSQLQAAADSTALAAAASMHLDRMDMEAVARRYASANTVTARPVQIDSSDIEYGAWDTATRTFTPSASPGNAVRITTRADRNNGGEVPLFFGRIFNMMSVRQEASAVAVTNPRDIAFVVDLSGSMNYDTDPNNTDDINRTFAPLGYPTIGTELMQQIYDDFNFGTFPGPSQHAGAPLGVSSKGDPLSKLTSTSGPLSKSNIPKQYRIKQNDSSSVRKQKAFAWVMDVQIPSLMPNVIPAPNSSKNYAYWADYLADNYRQIGYRSYVHFLMVHGRDEKPDGSTYTPLSQYSPDCPLHTESTAGGDFQFPPREQPTHAARRALIAALQVIKERNQNISDPNQRDWVSIVTFDRLTGGGPQLVLPLTSDYDEAMQACTWFQACSHNTASTATEAGLIKARQHLKPRTEGGSGRLATNKVVVLLTDGLPNLYETSSSTINRYIRDNPSDDFYGGSYPRDAALMQTAMMQTDHWFTYPVGIGLGCDYDFMDRMARTGATANGDGESPRGSGNPADYEERLTEIFRNIITNPKLRLVQ
jgi:Flp pilus assembly protein TadG